jgi:tetratricopeptide (TPR) repeat protein
MSGDALLMGHILLDAGKPDEAAKGGVALGKDDLATAKRESDAYMSAAEARKNNFRIRQAHELAGAIALKEKNYDTAIAKLGQANQQDPHVIYTIALAYQGKGDSAKAKEYTAKAANANVLPLVTYAFIREKAKKMAG